MLEKDPTSTLALDNKDAIEYKMEDEDDSEQETHKDVINIHNI